MSDSKSIPPPKDWAHLAALAVIADLSDRKGIKNALDSVEPDIKMEIVDSIAEIIRAAPVDFKSI